MKRLFIYINLLLILFTFNLLKSQETLSVLQNIQIKDNNCGFIYFSTIPKDFHSQLSKDKTKILINVIGASLNGTNREVHSTGQLKDIYSKQDADTIKITVLAKNNTGYTLVPLPYSNTLMIELFDWDKLNKAQDNYRKGLLAVENGIINPANKLLSIASELGNPNAAANLAFLQLFDGKLKSAFKNLLFANKLNSNIPDIYAGLSQIYKMFNINDKAKYYSELFTKMTGLPSFPEIIVGEIPVDDSLDIETIKLLEKINQPITKVEKIKEDSLNQKFKNVLTSKEKISVKQNSTWQVIKSFFPDWFFNYILIVLALVFLALAVLWFSYVKWKKIQLAKDEKKIIIDRSIDRNNFDDDLDLAKNTNAMQSHASNLYKESESISKNNSATKIENDQPVHNDQRNDIKVKKPKNPNNDNDFESKIDKIAKQLIDAQKTQNLEEYEDNLEQEKMKKKETLDASTKLANQLQSKKQKIKNENLEKLSDELPNDNNKINELAKNLNLEKRSLKTRKNLEDLKNDKKSIDNIKKKFQDKS